jgi:hypothetical protein
LLTVAGGKNGNYTRQRGYRAEAEWCKLLTTAGVPTKRHFMSGMFESGDCTTELPAEKLKGQVKRKKAVPAWLELDAHDYTATREDHGEWFVVLRASTFIKLCGGKA